MRTHTPTHGRGRATAAVDHAVIRHGGEAQDDRGGRGLAAVVVATVAFSAGFPIVKGIALPPASLSFWRLVIGFVTLAAVAFAVRSPWPRVAWPVVGAGVAFALHQVVFIQATKTTSIAIVTLLVALQPLLISLTSRRLVGEPVPRALVGFAGLAVLGVAVVVQANLTDASRSLSGDLLSVVNVVLFTAYFLFAKKARGLGAPTLTFTAGFLGVAMVALLPAVLLADRVVPVNAVDAGWLLVLALLPGNGHLLVNWAHRRVSAALSSLALSGVPLLAAVWARLFFGEPFGWPHAVGMGLVAAAIEGGRRVERRQSARRRTAVATPQRT